MNKKQIMQKADEVKYLESDLKNENSKFNQGYKDRYEELKEKGNKQKEQSSSLKERVQGIEQEMRMLMDEIEENEKQKEEFEKKRDIQQLYFEDCDKALIWYP